MWMQNVFIEKYLDANGRVRNGRGREGSKMRAFYTVWKLVGDQYVDGERSTAEELSWFFWPRMRGSMQGERYNRWKNDLSKYKTQGAKASLNSWLETSRLEEKFQRDRAYELLRGEPWKVKKDKQIEKDNLCELMAAKILNGEITTDRYMDRMIEIMGDYDD